MIKVFFFLQFLLWTEFTSSQDLFHSKEENLDLQPSDVIHWSGYDCQSYSNGYTLVKVQLQTEQQFRIYKKKLEFFQEEGWYYVGSKMPKSRQIVDPISKENVDVYDKGEFVLLFKGVDQFTEKKFSFNIKYLGCTQKICLFPYVENVLAENYISSESFPKERLALFTDLPKNITKNKNPKEFPVKDKSLHLEEQLLQMSFGENNTTFWVLLLLAFLGGLLTNLTPCVYPMIPITIRLLARETTRPLWTSSSYALGIMSTYTLLGVIAVSTGALFGALMANSLFNLCLAMTMFFLGIGMLGFANFSYVQQIGVRIGENQSGLLKTFFMGAGAGLVASPCTGPILASLLTYVTTLNNSFEAIAILFTYSFGFGIPYVFLGQISSKISQIKVKPWVANCIKIFFSSIIFALGFYYLRIPLYTIHKSLKDYWLLLLTISSVFSLVLFLCSFLVKENFKKIYFVVPSLFLGFSFLSFYQWQNIKRSSNSRDFLTWRINEDEALLEAHNNNRPVLIDMWAEWCEACKQMDVETFSNKLVIKELLDKNWILVKSDLTKSGTKEAQSIQKRYNVKGLPTLVILPNGKQRKFFNLKGFVSAKKLLDQLQKYGI